MGEDRLLEPFESRGEWFVWERGFPGVLRFSPSRGVEVDIDATPRHTGVPPPPVEIAALPGRLADGTPVVLLDSFQRHYRAELGLSWTATYVTDIAVVGTEDEDPQPHELRARVDHLGEWLGVSGFGPADAASGEWAIRYEHPKPLRLGRHDGFTIEVEFEFRRVSGRRSTATAVSARQLTWLRIATPEPRPLRDFLRIFRQVRDFLSFAVRAHVRVLELGAELQGESSQAVILRRARGPIVADEVASREMLFLYRDADRGETPLEHWLVRAESLGVVYELFLVARYEPRTYTEFQFLAHVQALESLHAFRYGDVDVPTKILRERIQRVMKILESDASIEETDRAWVTSRLGWNKPSLSRRLHDLFDTFPPLAGRALHDREALVSRIVATRNYRTHPARRPPKAAATGQELIRLTVGLELIIEVLLLAELGFGGDEIDRLIERNQVLIRRFNWSLAPSSAQPNM